MVRRQNHVGHPRKPRLGRRLLCEDVEPRARDGSRLQRRDQRRFVHHAAPRHVDQGALRPQRRQHLGIHHVVRRVAARHYRDQDVGPLRQRVRAVEKGVGHVPFAARMIADRGPEGGAARGDGLSDRPQPEDAHPLAAQRRSQRKGPVGRPVPRPHPGIRLDHAPPRGDHQPQRKIRHIVVKHAGRVGHRHAPPAAGREVEAVGPDAQGRDQLERGQTFDDLRLDATPAGGDDATDARADLLQQRRRVIGRVEAVQGVAGVKRLHLRRVNGGEDEKIGFLCHATVVAPGGAKCKLAVEEQGRAFGSGAKPRIAAARGGDPDR